MTKPTLNSSDSLPNQEAGATCGELTESMDSLWRPSWLHWLISALSGTVEIEKQTAWLKGENAKLDAMILRTRNEKKQIEKETEKIKKENERLAVLESKIEVLFCKYGINLSPAQTTEKP